MVAGIANENDPRVKRTRQLLLNAFHELGADRDLRDITVKDITERATVNRATFYAHFRDKDALMDSAFRGRIQSELSGAFPPSAPLNASNLRLLCSVACDFMNTTVRRCPRTNGTFQPHSAVAVQEELSGFILSWIESQPTDARRRERAPRPLAAVLSWSLFGAAVEWVREPDTKSQDEIATQVVDLLADALL